MVYFGIALEGVKPDEFTMASYLTGSVREVSLVVLTLEGRVQEVTRPVLFSLYCRVLLGVHGRPFSLFLSLEVIPRLRHFHRDLCLTQEIVMDVERLDILGNIVQKRVTDPK